MRSTARDRRSNSGIILPITLFIVTILAVVVLQGFSSAHRLASLVAREVRETREAERLLEALLDRADAAPPSPHPFSCSDLGVEEAPRALCALHSSFDSSPSFVETAFLAGGARRPLMEVDAFFSMAAPCPATSIPFPLVSPGSLASDRWCGAFLPLHEPSFKRRGNVMGPRLALPGGAHGATGFIMVGLLETNGDTLLLAGGDLVVNQLTTLGLADVTLVSLTGVVQVVTTSPLAKVRAYGRRVLVPASNLSPLNRTLPPFVDRVVVGLASNE